MEQKYLELLRQAVAGWFPKPQPLRAFDWLDPGLAGKLELLALSELSRIQWVSPTFARVLVAAGYITAKKLAGANPERLCEAVVAANQDARFYKGKVGLRHIKRLVAAAAYVPGR